MAKYGAVRRYSPQNVDNLHKMTPFDSAKGVLAAVIFDESDQVKLFLGIKKTAFQSL